MTHVFRKFFKISQNKKARKSSLSSKLELITLEERITPATYTVLNNNDAGPDSLRRAIVDSNLTIESDTIVFSGVVSGITLASALPAIDKTSTAGTLTITGPGSSSLTISGNNGVASRNFNIFNISAGGNLAISGVTVSGAIISGDGGAFANDGTLTISSSIVSGNTTSGTFSSGGGIYNSRSGTLTVSNSTIFGNTASASGGGILNYGGNLTVNNSTISGNSATAATNGGGGIRNQGTLNLLNSTISSNAAPAYGGGISNGGGTLNIANTIIANSTGSTGAAIFLVPVL